jgi:hypothetical protein
LIDWSQFVPAIIATFLGFGLALFGQWLWEKLKNNGDLKKLKQRIKTELEQVRKTLISVSGINIEPLKIPTWRACISTGDLKILKGNIQRDLFFVYNTIAEYNSWSLIQANYYFEKGKLNTELMVELEKLKNTLLYTNGNEKSIPDILSFL